MKLKLPVTKERYDAGVQAGAAHIDGDANLDLGVPGLPDDPLVRSWNLFVELNAPSVKRAGFL